MNATKIASKIVDSIASVDFSAGLQTALNRTTDTLIALIDHCLAVAGSGIGWVVIGLTDRVANLVLFRRDQSLRPIWHDRQPPPPSWVR